MTRMRTKTAAPRGKGPEGWLLRKTVWRTGGYRVIFKRGRPPLRPSVFAMHAKKNRSLNLLLLAGSLLAGLLFCEVLARFIYSPSDIFPAHPATDPVLGHRLLPHESGHDARGFRNQEANGDFPVVCIGDSLTYGAGIPRQSAFPQLLGRIINQRVYNMGMGGYGPVQYYQLLNQAKELHPQKIIIVLYLGNDLLDAEVMVERHACWKWLLQNSGPKDQLASIPRCKIPYKPLVIKDLYYAPDVITLKLKEGGSLVWRVHSWLRLHSAFYALQYEGVVKPLIQRIIERKKHMQQPGAFACREVDTVFTPGINLKRIDLQYPKVRQGLVVTRRIIELMGEKPYKNELLFTFIPTKEAVYYKYLKKKKVSLPAEYECLVHYEKAITAWLAKAITAGGLQVVDVFPALEKAALQGKLLYHFSSDAHLNVAGSRLVASSLAQALEINR